MKMKFQFGIPSARDRLGNVVGVYSVRGVRVHDFFFSKGLTLDKVKVGAKRQDEGRFFSWERRVFSSRST